MLAALCTRPRPRLLTSLSLSYAHAHGSGSAPFDRWINSKGPPFPVLAGGDPKHHSTKSSGAASIWRAMLSFGWQKRRRLFTRRDHEGEGSWNVAWDARPARWLHHPDSAGLLFGLATAPLIDFNFDVSSGGSLSSDGLKTDKTMPESTYCDPASNYRVTGVVADGRCLFRAIAHMACLRNGEEAPDDNRQRELADELRAQVVEELLRRRKEVEWFIEEEFDVYVKRIQQPYVWGGEPELLMSSHVLRRPVTVFMKERTSGILKKIANYGEEYQKDEENDINVLFHGYGHYDILETIPDSSQKANA